jgi:hypothetical protein
MKTSKLPNFELLEIKAELFYNQMVERISYTGSVNCSPLPSFAGNLITHGKKRRVLIGITLQLRYSLVGLLIVHFSLNSFK